jgi:hypothetical protein
MAGKKPSQKAIKEIVGTVDHMDRISLLKAFRCEHPEAKKKLADREELDRKIKSGEGLLDLRQSFNIIGEAVYLQKPKPIARQLPLFEEVDKWLTQFESVVYSNEDAFRQYTAAVPEFLEVILRFVIPRRIIEMAIWGIKNRTGNIVHINYAHSKALLMEEFEKLLDEDLPASPLYKERKKIREQSEKRLKDYLKVWRLRDQGLSYRDIALIVYHSVEKEERAKKQFYKTYEIIYGKKYDVERFARYKIDSSDQRLCDSCPMRSSCQEACPTLISSLGARDVKLKEKPIGDIINLIDLENEIFDDSY